MGFLFAAFQAGLAGGVTLITHGLNGDVDGWVTGMATNIPNYERFPGTNFTCYEMYFYASGGSYYLTADQVGGSAPADTDSGEIVVKLDWRQLADGNSYNTYQIAAFVVPALLSTNFFPGLGGHALAELPLHLIGHSRGGSLICEMSRLLGTNGVWVDQVTTLDPHPLNDSAFPLDFLLYSAVDAPAVTYANILFHDNYWQDLNSFVYGKSVNGAYVRQLISLDGGYGGLTGSHSDVHLWYHGTLDWRTPTSDTEASITSAERSSWWTAYESNGVVAGFKYSLIGGGNRLSTDQPLGSGSPEIRDGYNQWWDFGAGVFDNRTGLPSDNGNWPNLIRFDRTETNQVTQGKSTPVSFAYQWARVDTNLATVSIYLDDDFNPFNQNQRLLAQIPVPANGASYVSFVTTNITFEATNAAPGDYQLFGAISGGGRTRYLYAPETVQIISGPQPPRMEIQKPNDTQFVVSIAGAPGQTIVLQTSPDLKTWFPLVTNSLTTEQWFYTNSLSTDGLQNFYRAVREP